MRATSAPAVRLTALRDATPATTSTRLAWIAAHEDGCPVGTAYLRLFLDADREDTATLELTVHPANRRAGVGTSLLRAALEAAREHDRLVVEAEARQGSAGDVFLTAHGFQQVLALRYARLRVADVDRPALDALAQEPHPGYRLRAWTGEVPDDVADSAASARRAMDDMPTGERVGPPVRWDAQRLREAARAVAARGEVLDTVVALDEDGQVVGFTELVVAGDGRGDGQHYGTGVLPEHRGRGLALWMKAEALRRAVDRWPHLDGLLVDTAVENAAMRAVNDRLGYSATHVSRLLSLQVGAASTRSSGA